MGEFLLVDLRPKFRNDLYIVFWRTNGQGYCYSIPWAWLLTQEELEKDRNYLLKTDNETIIRMAIHKELLKGLTVKPRPNIIDGNVGPVLENSSEMRNTLITLRYQKGK